MKVLAESLVHLGIFCIFVNFLANLGNLGIDLIHSNCEGGVVIEQPHWGKKAHVCKGPVGSSLGFQSRLWNGLLISTKACRNDSPGTSAVSQTVLSSHLRRRTLTGTFYSTRMEKWSHPTDSSIRKEHSGSFQAAWLKGLKVKIHSG